MAEKQEISQTERMDLNHNVAAKIINPLEGLSRHHLLRNVDEFVAEKGLPDNDAFRKGALLAQDPDNFENIADLSEEDKEAIRYERAHKWSHPMILYVTIFLCSVGAATQGWDQTGSNGANLSFPLEFGIAEDDPVHGPRNQWIVGVVNAAPYITSAAVGAWLADPLNNWFGRRKTIFITALILIATPIGSGFTHSWETLFVVRLILGIGMGCKGATVPVFAAENSPAQIRGALVMGWQLWTAFGLFLGYAANVVVQNTGAIAWRLQLGSAFIPAVPLACGILFCPESPRWLIKKGRYLDAYKSLLKLRHHKIQATRDLYYMSVQIAEEQKIIRAATFFARAMELFTIPRVRRATVASGVVMLAQQMCGINIIAFYSSSVFANAGYSSRNALYASLGFGAVNFAFAWPAIFTIDTFGRRTLLLFTFPQMAWSLLAAGLCFLIRPSTSTTAVGLVAFFIYLFAAFYSPGEGPVPFTYSAEVFPLSHREQGMAWAVAVCLGFAAVLSITFPRMVGAMTITGAFCFYAGLNVTAFFMIFFLVPETKQRTLEELDQIFSVPTRVFARYQLTQTMPYFFKRWVFMRKDAKLAPLFHHEHVQHERSETASLENEKEKIQEERVEHAAA
ncbi:unnamed protein product [Peniophora sp. CBMAI 1063]|nr:unnamed protein product [Peniophora sp. CBMAI 1063]